MHFHLFLPVCYRAHIILHSNDGFWTWYDRLDLCPFLQVLLDLLCVPTILYFYFGFRASAFGFYVQSKPCPLLKRFLMYAYVDTASSFLGAGNVTSIVFLSVHDNNLDDLSSNYFLLCVWWEIIGTVSVAQHANAPTCFSTMLPLFSICQCVDFVWADFVTPSIIIHCNNASISLHT